MTVSEGPTPPAHHHIRPSLRGAHVDHQLRAGHGRLRHRVLVAFAGLFAAVVGLSALGTAVGAPSGQPLCRPYRPCGPPRIVRPLINQTVWRSGRWGFSLEYPSNEMAVSQQDAGSVTLQVDLGNGNTGTILVQGYSPADASPGQAIARQIGDLSGVSQMGADTNPADQLLGSGVGYRPGAGRVFTGYFAAPQGVGQRVALASEAASDGSVTVSVTVGGPAGETGPSSLLYALGDQVINSIHWPAGGSGGGAP